MSTRALSLPLLLVAVVLSAGCPGWDPFAPDAGTKADLANTAISDSGVAHPTVFPISWRLHNCHGSVPMVSCGLLTSCQEAGTTKIHFTATGVNATPKVTTIDCASAAKEGTATLALDGPGPYTVSAKLDGVASSTSIMGCNLNVEDGYTLYIYALSCSEGCTTCQ